MEEFFNQGDQEKELGLDMSPLCDRNTTQIPQSQIGKYLKHYAYQIIKFKFFVVHIDTWNLKSLRNLIFFCTLGFIDYIILPLFTTVNDLMNTVLGELFKFFE